VAVEPARALELVDEAIACTLRSGDHLYNCLLHNNASFQAVITGNIPVARGHLEAMARAARRIGYGGLEFHGNMGLVLRAEGDIAGSQSRYEECLRAGRREGAGLGMALGLLGIAHAVGDLGDWERAGTLQGAAQAVADRTGARWYEPEAGWRRDSLARARAHLGDERLARAYARGTALTTEEAFDLALAPASLAAPVAAASPVAAGASEDPVGPGGALSARERQIITLLAGGASNAAIAAALFVTVNTVRTHLDRIRDKTGARNRAELTRYAMLAGIEPAFPAP
jgi:DNA-binding CsgD family transcriptional regulator